MKTEIKYKGYFTVEVRETLCGKREVQVAHDSVSLLVYIPRWNKIVLLNQPRVGMMSKENPDGFTMELIAGRVDKDIPLKDIIIDEASKEAGISLRPEQIKLLNRGEPMAISAGGTTEKSYLAFAEADPEQILEPLRTTWGDPQENEIIERYFIELEELNDFECEDVRVFALIQFLLRKKKSEE